MIGDPLADLKALSIRPEPFHPTGRLTEEHWKKLAIGKDGFLWLAEIDLAAQVLMNNSESLAWEDSERGQFR